MYAATAVCLWNPAYIILSTPIRQQRWTEKNHGVQIDTGSGYMRWIDSLSYDIISYVEWIRLRILMEDPRDRDLAQWTREAEPMLI